MGYVLGGTQIAKSRWGTSYEDIPTDVPHHDLDRQCTLSVPYSNTP